MAAFQKSGVIIVTVLLALLQKIKLQNYRLFILDEENKGSDDTHLNFTRLNGTDNLFEGENVSRFLFRCLLVNNFVAAVACLSLTAWSDRHGRKLLLMLPYIGSFLSDIVTLIVVCVPSTTSKMLLISEAIDGFLGGAVLISLGCLCYITDSTDDRERTFLIAMYFGLWNAIPVMDMAFQYYWTPEIGLPFRELIICGVIYRMAFAACFFVYIKLCIPESVFLLGTYEGNPWTNLLTPINVSDTIKCVFRRRVFNDRPFLIILTTVFIFYTISLFGDIITYPHYFRSVFLWPYKDIFLFSGIFALCQALTLWFSTYLAKEWKSLDTDLGIYGCISIGMACLVLTFSKRSYFAAFGVIIGIGSLLVPVSTVSLLSKFIDRHEIGRLFGSLGFLTLMLEIIAATSYPALYDACQQAEIPQVIFLLSFGLIAFCLFFFIYLKRNISPTLFTFMTGSECLALINERAQYEQLFD